jgi:hypothetical protein
VKKPSDEVIKIIDRFSWIHALAKLAIGFTVGLADH